MIGITERGDAALDTSWFNWVQKQKPAILISKNPLQLASHLLRFDDPNVIVHATITGYGSTVLEPNVKSVEESMIGLKALKKIIGAQRIVLRIDPIIPTTLGIETAINVLKQALEISDFRVRISFIDNYQHVKNRFSFEQISLPWESFHAPLELRKKALEELQDIKENIEICSEPDFTCTGCVSELDCQILNVESLANDNRQKKRQREECRCLSLKKELLTKKTQCDHKCLYCYYGKFD